MRAMPIALAALLLPPLARRAARPGTPQAEAAAMDRQAAAFRARFPSPRTGFLDRARCEETARRTLLHAVGAPSDQVEPYLSAISDLVTRTDRGEMTPWQARAALARKRVLLAERERWRHPEDAAPIGAHVR